MQKVSAGRLFRRITLRYESFVYLVMIPLAIYFVYFAGRFDTDELKVIIPMALIASFFVLAVQLTGRYIRLKRIVEGINNPEADHYEIKKLIIRHPLYETGFVLFRWITGVALSFTLVSMVIEVSTMQIAAMIVLVLLSIPYSSVFSYFFIETEMAEYRNHPVLAGISVKRDEVTLFSENGRKVAIVFSIALLPALIFGFFFIMVNNYDIGFENPVLHISLISLMTVIAAGVTIYESARNNRVTLSAILNVLERIGKGELVLSRVPLMSNSELGFLSEDINRLSKGLYEIISDVKEASQAVIQGSDEISSAAHNLSSSTSEQAANVEEINSSMEHLSNTVEQNAKYAGETSQVAENTSQRALEGREIVEKTVTAMNKIAEMTQVVQDIADQTNLLSLNATIEAARAGKHGAGFAVVANEVRQLAEKSQRGAANIIEIVRESVQVAERAGELFSKIQPEIEKTADLVGEISAASEEQSTGIAQVSSGISQMSDMTAQNATFAEELSATADTLHSHAEQLEKSISRFRTA